MTIEFKIFRSGNPIFSFKKHMLNCNCTRIRFQTAQEYFLCDFFIVTWTISDYVVIFRVVCTIFSLTVKPHKTIFANCYF